MAIDNKAKCSKSPPLVFFWYVTEPDQHCAQNRKENECKETSGNRGWCNLTFGVCTPVGQTENDQPRDSHTNWLYFTLTKGKQFQKSCGHS